MRAYSARSNSVGALALCALLLCLLVDEAVVHGRNHGQALVVLPSGVVSADELVPLGECHVNED